MVNINSFIGKYRIIGELGSGTFGSVYKAQHTFFTNRVVAIKLMQSTSLNSVKEQELFFQEARFLEMLKHPYILPIIDIDMYEGRPYLVTEYAPNGSLGDLLKRQPDRPLPWQQAIKILSQIGQALQLAHQQPQPVVHRDLKPENILFNSRGDALLADFGIATILNAARTTSVDMIGTPQYMAPEQFQGIVSVKSDQYALGCIAYTLVTGRPPFITFDAIALGFKHLTEAPIAPGQLNPYIPPHVEQAILKAMAKDRNNRYPDISSFIKAMSTASISHTSRPSIIPLQEPLAPTTLPHIPNPNDNPGGSTVHATKQLRLDIAQLTDIGRKATYNQDNMGYVIPKDAQVMRIKGALLTVADGLAELPSGEIASEIAIDTVTDMYYQDDSDDVVTSLLQAIRRANALILRRAAERGLQHGMGTTLVAAVLRGNQAFIANVGNCRAYLIRRNRIVQLSKDHSWVAEQEQAGLLTKDQAHSHPNRNVLTRYLGLKANIEIDLFLETVHEGDVLIFCTDGLFHLVNNDEILAIANQYVPQESVYHLIERANEHGGDDNITAVVVRILESGL